MQTNKILMIVASKNFRDEEYQHPLDVFKKAGYSVTIASTTKKVIPGMLSMKIKADILLQDVQPSDYDAVVFVGGSGSTEYWDHPKAHEIALEMNKEEKVVAAICLAPLTLGKCGLMKGVKGTIYESAKKEFIQTGAIFKDKNVIVQDNIVTANGPAAAKKFGNEIVRLLQEKQG
ncbi:MAG TPA: DJ-1/PfpI family protein [Caldisericia bacterium]|nr:DJ-1/PfpI family protein [Caldisericia bacterium]HXK51903.1 DJ-1/PfpI family protein [Caldisericia bacterium]